MIEYFQIELSRGQIAQVSSEDWEDLIKHKWFARWDATIQSFYAVRSVRLDSGKQGQVQMHRQIMGNPVGLLVDHRSGNTLDNRRSELRVATPLENSRNAKIRSDNTSGYKGVTWVAEKNKWVAKIRIEGARLHLGSFESAELAHRAYEIAAREHFGQFKRAA